MSILRSLAFTLGTSGLSIFASNLSATNTTDRIIGKNDLVKVPASYANDHRMQAIGLMELGCTVTHVGRGIAITAGHCFASSNFQGVKKNLPCSESKYSIHWGYLEGVDSYLTSQCTNIIATELNSERDYAIFRVSSIPDGFIDVNGATAAIGDDISIYSHPKKRTLEWSNWCKVEGLISKSNGNQFYYSCDTEPGSSGAAVLDSNDRIVGIHNYYNGPLDRNGATLITKTPLIDLLTGSFPTNDFNPRSRFLRTFAAPSIHSLLSSVQ